MLEEHHSLFVVALNTGLRNTEQLSLTWDDIDFQQELIRVKRSQSGIARSVPVRTVVIEALKSWPRMIDNRFFYFGRSEVMRLRNLCRRESI